MTVKEYAESVSLSVAEILKKCESLGIDVKNADDVLSDDDVINLDFATNLISTDSESTYEEEDSMDEVVEDLVLSTNIHTMNPETKKQKLKKRSEIESSKSEYFNKRKEMYKHKEKLMTNQAQEDVILYKNGMTVADFRQTEYPNCHTQVAVKLDHTKFWNLIIDALKNIGEVDF